MPSETTERKIQRFRTHREDSRHHGGTHNIISAGTSIGVALGVCGAEIPQIEHYGNRHALGDRRLGQYFGLKGSASTDPNVQS